jgi:hypothetical protein
MPIIEELTAISTPLSTCAAVGELQAGFELRELSIMIGRSSLPGPRPTSR